MRNIFILIFGLLATALYAEETADSTATAGRTDSLFVDVDLKAFFLNNEYEGGFRKGYTLPGARFAPRVRYKPNEHLEFELGLSALLFNGANKYPCYAYKDISTWKGSQYQEGVHLLPWYRIKYMTGKSEIILGDLNDNHAYLTPLYNHEMYFSKDPDMGLQYRLNLNRYHLDAWVDWQSFIFNGDKHQEALFFGLLQSYKVYEKNSYSLVVPLHVMIQHYGGEIDNSDTGAPVLWNAATGIQGYWKDHSRHHDSASAELLFLYYKGNGRTIETPFSSGAAFWGSMGYNLRQKLNMKLGIFYAAKFLSNYGAPFFSTISLEEPGATFSHVTTTMLDVRYTPLDCKYGKLSIFGTAYLTSRGAMIARDGIQQEGSKFVLSYTYGLTFASNLSFLVWHKKK